MDTTMRTARGLAFSSVMCLLRFPIGLAKTDGDWLFIPAAITALCISMAVLIVGMSVGPTFEKKVLEHGNKALCIAGVSVAVAAYPIALLAVGDSFWMLLFVKVSWIVFIGLTCATILVPMWKTGGLYAVDN